jgi:hypothetical protein
MGRKEPTEVILQKQQETVGILAACGGEDVKLPDNSSRRFKRVLGRAMFDFGTYTSDLGQGTR